MAGPFLASCVFPEAVMEERIRFVTHKNRKVLLVDVSNCTPDQVAQLSRLVPSYVTAEPLGSVLLLADFSGAKFDKAAVASLKQGTVYDRPHLKRSAWVGTETLAKVFYENIKAFSQRDLPTFKTREEALDWLVQEVPAA
jgi:SpoIIAA-like